MTAEDASETLRLLAESNECPSEVQLHDVRLRIAKVSSSIAGLEEKKSSLKPDVYYIRRAHYRKLEKLYRHILAPFRRVPVDIILHIFDLCYTQPALDTYSFNHNYRWRYPLRLSHVCQGWRSLVRETPNLWNKVHSTLPTYKERSEYSWLTTQMVHAASSSTLHIFILFFDTLYPGPTLSRAMKTFSDALLPNLHRLITIELDGTIPIDILLSFLTLPAGSLPVLESFSLCVGFKSRIKGHSTAPSDLPITVFRNATRLRKLQFSTSNRSWGMLQDLSQIMTRIPCEQLVQLGIAHDTKYTIIGLRPTDITEFTKRCVNVEIISWPLFFVPEDTKSGPIILNKVHTLRMYLIDRYDPYPNRPGFDNIAQLVVPLLTHANFDGIVCPHVSLLIQNSSCQLTKLSIRNAATTVEDMLSLLKLTPMLTDLTSILCVTTISDFFVALTERSDNDDSEELALVPCLQFMVLKCRRDYTKSETLKVLHTAIADMVEARWAAEDNDNVESVRPPSTKRLKRFHLCAQAKMGGQQRTRLAKFRAKGLDLKLTEWF